MARTSNHVIETLTEQLAAAIGQPIETSKWSPGDGWTRYALHVDGRTIGPAVMTRNELEATLRMALHIADILAPQQTTDRLNAYWEARNAA